MINVNSNSKKTLLLGSGFSKNFGGYLPKDVFLKIFNHKKINTELRSYLLSFREDNYNFEGFYQAVLDLKCDQFSHEEIAAVKSVLTEIYKMMDDLFERKMRNPLNDFSYLSVINFIVNEFSYANGGSGLKQMLIHMSRKVEKNLA